MPTGPPPGLDRYRRRIDLDRPFHPAAAPAAPESFEHLVDELLVLLATERGTTRIGRFTDAGQGRGLLRALLTVRAPGPLPAAAVPLLDALLGGERAQRPLVDVSALPTIADQHPATRYPAAATTVLWRGDLTTLRADAIVNAANAELLGCFQPAHRCIDNVLHAAAGPRLRADCHTVMSAQGRPEPAGAAKITRGYHLPARYLLHTVGPVVGGPLNAGHEAALAAAYRSCLELAARIDGIRTLAFCSISTGVFGYPKVPAARTALTAVAAWTAAHPGRLDRVVFDVYSAADLDAYQTALTEWAHQP